MKPFIEEEFLETWSVLSMDSGGTQNMSELVMALHKDLDDAKGTLCQPVKRALEYLTLLKEQEIRSREWAQRQLNEAMVELDIARKELAKAKAQVEGLKSLINGQGTELPKARRRIRYVPSIVNLSR